MKAPSLPAGVYGSPPPELAAAPVGATQLSPLIPGGEALEDLVDGGLVSIVVAAPPGVLERRYVLAQALRGLAPGCVLTALAPKQLGGARLRAELEAFGCQVIETARRHHRICAARRPAAPTGLDAAIVAGGPQWAPGLEAWSQPGVFSWDRLDPGSALLIASTPAFAGRGADLGCGVGVLARAVLACPAVTSLALIDRDARAVAAAKRNIDDRRAFFLHRDVRHPDPALKDLDFVIMNPPFHQSGARDSGLGQAFIRAAASSLRPGGVCRLVANQTLPYEAALREAFAAVTPLGAGDGYKLYEARR